MGRDSASASPASPVTTLLLKAFLRPWKRLHVSAYVCMGDGGVAVPLMQPFLFGHDMQQEAFRKEYAAGEDAGGDTEESGIQLCTV